MKRERCAYRLFLSHLDEKRAGSQTGRVHDGNELQDNSKFIYIYMHIFVHGIYVVIYGYIYAVIYGCIYIGIYRYIYINIIYNI